MIKHCSNTIIHLQLFGELIVGEVGVDFLHLFPVPTSKVMDNKIRGSQPTSALPHTKARLASEEDATRIRVQTHLLSAMLRDAMRAVIEPNSME